MTNAAKTQNTVVLRRNHAGPDHVAATECSCCHNWSMEMRDAVRWAEEALAGKESPETVLERIVGDFKGDD